MRNYNIDREPISSDEISTFKDFKSIMRKHAQTTEDLAKIKPAGSSNKLYWIVGGAISAVTVGALLMFSGGSEEVKQKEAVVVEQKPEVKKVVETPAIEWQTIIRTPQNSVEQAIGVNVISANRVDYAKFEQSAEVSSLIKNINKSDVGFVASSLVFKVDQDEELEISNANELYKLNEEGKWVKVEYTPTEMAYIEKPVLLEKGDAAIKMNFNNYTGPASKYENVFWKPVNIKDLDESFFTTNWEDASVEKTSINGVYTLKFKAGEVEKRFNGYPALQSVAYEEAMRDYNKKLLKAQEDLMVAPKEYKVSKGIYTVK